MDPAVFKDLTQKAVKAALTGQWEEAVKLNQQILQQVPANTEALNRLARALVETNQALQAKQIYKKVLQIDKYNPIALKNLQRLELAQGNRHKAALLNSSQSFLEEPGKTKTTKLVRLGSIQTLAELSSGNSLEIVPKKRLITLHFKKNYIGSLPEDLSFRLIKLIKRGNQYTALVKAITKNDLTVFLQEIRQDSKNINIISFPSH
ncbi:tetratricopeptide repeat protein [Patescibacteria group bacterium]|nr:tetratricopeptide repeat protein [Patescibacteria group bacterium]MBU1931697.1 tetratricopeptide repeat protein [Patescibacteria group bacterium]